MRFAIKSIITAAVLGASAFGVASANAASLEILGTGHSMDLNTVAYNPAPSSAVGNFLSQNSSNPAFNKQIVYFDEENKITNGLINGLALLGGRRSCASPISGQKQATITISTCPTVWCWTVITRIPIDLPQPQHRAG